MMHAQRRARLHAHPSRRGELVSQDPGGVVLIGKDQEPDRIAFEEPVERPHRLASRFIHGYSPPNASLPQVSYLRPKYLVSIAIRLAGASPASTRLTMSLWLAYRSGSFSKIHRQGSE